MNLEQKILAVLRDHPHIRLAILFGSRAKGEELEESDLDLAVDAGHNLSIDEKVKLITSLAEMIGLPVDLVDLHAAGEPITGQILRFGKRIMGSDADYANIIRRHLFDNVDFLPYRNRILAERRMAWIGK